MFVAFTIIITLLLVFELIKMFQDADKSNSSFSPDLNIVKVCSVVKVFYLLSMDFDFTFQIAFFAYPLVWVSKRLGFIFFCTFAQFSWSCMCEFFFMFFAYLW